MRIKREICLLAKREENRYNKEQNERGEYTRQEFAAMWRRRLS